jgi:hypothetical protein
VSTAKTEQKGKREWQKLDKFYPTGTQPRWPTFGVANFSQNSISKTYDVLIDQPFARAFVSFVEWCHLISHKHQVGNKNKE